MQRSDENNKNETSHRFPATVFDAIVCLANVLNCLALAIGSNPEYLLILSLLYAS